MSDKDIQLLKQRKRPSVTKGVTFQIDTGCGKVHITVNEVNQLPFESFISMGKSGGCINGFLEGLGKSISIGLQYGVPLKAYAKILKGIRCPSPYGIQGSKNSCLSCLDGISKSLKKCVEVLEEQEIMLNELGTLKKENVPETVEDKIGKAIVKLNEKGHHDADSELLATKAIVEKEEVADSGSNPQCKECGEMLVFEEGCQKCRSCGWSACG